MLLDLSCASAVSETTTVGAGGPRIPGFLCAVDGAGKAVALFVLRICSSACAATSLHGTHNASVPLGKAGRTTGCIACTPCTKLGSHTVHGTHPTVASFCLKSGRAFLATEFCGNSGVAVALLLAVATSVRAFGPIFPSRELAVDRARFGITRLVPVGVNAVQTSVLGGDNNLPGTKHVALATRFRALTPLSPFAKLAVDRAHVLVARLRLLEAGASKIVFGLVLNSTRAVPDATAACLGALGERSPLRNLAVDGALPLRAGNRLGQGWTRVATEDWLFCDSPDASLGAMAAAGVAAFGEITEITNLAIHRTWHGDVLARLLLSQVGASLAAGGRCNSDTSEALAIASATTAVARRPASACSPAGDQAIDRAGVDVARLRHFKRRAWDATVRGLCDHVPGTLPHANATAARA